MRKIDLSKKYKSYYTAQPTPELVTIEPATFLSIKGKGDPCQQPFADAVHALYATAYGIKYLCKLWEKDFVTPKLEGLWSYDKAIYHDVSLSEAPLKIPRTDWTYTLLLRLPDFVWEKEITQAIDVARLKKKILPQQEIFVQEIPSHQAVQILHIGPYEKEVESLEKVTDFMSTHDLTKKGMHHEIYLSDFRKTVPEKLKTILREPIA